ncbi:MAG TPA: nucleotidyltransferase domain-containing protein [Ignavibacteriales bacterium]|nr:nucleotidyltransferase domain-containing protein [Ignavibacteriales bacterium]
MEKIKLVSKHIGLRRVKRNKLDKISQDFANNVRKKLGNHVKEIILFGSHARGDFTEGSDYDFLIVVDKRRKTDENILLDIGVEFLDKYEALIAEILCDEKEWEKKKRFPIGLNILKEGVWL